MRIASFDVGRCNFAQYVEDFDMDFLIKLKGEYKSLPKCDQRRVKGPMNKGVEKILKKVSTKKCKRIQTGVYNFTKEKSQKLDNDVRLKLIKHLNEYKYLFEGCDIFIIEQQYFSTGGRRAKAGVNMDAIKLGESLYFWLLLNFPKKDVMYFSSSYKTQIFGATLKMTKDQRKKWATEKVREIYEKRNDVDMINIFNLCDEVKGKRMNSEEKILEYNINCPVEENLYELRKKVVCEKQKMDDVSDACLQCQTYKFRKYVACF